MCLSFEHVRRCIFCAECQLSTRTQDVLKLHAQQKDKEPLSVKDTANTAVGSLIDGIDDGCNVEGEDNDVIDDVGIEEDCENMLEV